MNTNHHNWYLVCYSQTFCSITHVKCYGNQFYQQSTLKYYGHNPHKYQETQSYFYNDGDHDKNQENHHNIGWWVTFHFRKYFFDFFILTVSFVFLISSFFIHKDYYGVFHLHYQLYSLNCCLIFFFCLQVKEHRMLFIIGLVNLQELLLGGALVF